MQISNKKKTAWMTYPKVSIRGAVHLGRESEVKPSVEEVSSFILLKAESHPNKRGGASIGDALLIETLGYSCIVHLSRFRIKHEILVSQGYAYFAWPYGRHHHGKSHIYTLHQEIQVLKGRHSQRMCCSFDRVIPYSA